jgi:hypothetical protein
MGQRKHVRTYDALGRCGGHAPLLSYPCGVSPLGFLWVLFPLDGRVAPSKWLLRGAYLKLVLVCCRARALACLPVPSLLSVALSNQREPQTQQPRWAWPSRSICMQICKASSGEKLNKFSVNFPASASSATVSVE